MYCSALVSALVVCSQNSGSTILFSLVILSADNWSGAQLDLFVIGVFTHVRKVWVWITSLSLGSCCLQLSCTSHHHALQTCSQFLNYIPIGYKLQCVDVNSPLGLLQCIHMLSCRKGPVSGWVWWETWLPIHALQDSLAARASISLYAPGNRQVEHENLLQTKIYPPLTHYRIFPLLCQTNTSGKIRYQLSWVL